MQDQPTDDGSIKVAGTYTIKAPTTDEQGMAFILYADQTVKWAVISELEEEATDGE